MSGLSFDSNIIIDALNGHDPARAELLAAPQRLLSRVAWIEVMAGIPPGPAPLVQRVLDLMTLVELDEPISQRAAAIRRDYKRLKLPDAIILATAQLQDSVLLTRNTKDFPADMPGIRVPYTI